MIDGRSPQPTFRKAARLKLNLEMRRQLLPLLQNMGFSVRRKKGIGKDKDGFPLDYYRLRKDHAEIVQFQWDKYHGPSFIINFAMIDDPMYRNSLPPDAETRWFIDHNYRAASSTSVHERWFRVGLIARYLWPDAAVKRVASQAALRLREIDKFMTEKRATKFIRGRDGDRAPEWNLQTPNA